MHRTFVLVLTMIYFVGCSVCKPQPLSAYPVEQEQIDKSLITGEPCPPPCWQGITPGQTNYLDTYGILSQLEFIDQDSMSNTSDAYLSWHSSFTDTEKAPIGSINFNEDGIVSRIAIWQLEYPLSLQELFEIVGEPEAVTFFLSGGNFPECYHTIFIWPTDGLEVALPPIPPSELPDSPPYITGDELIMEVRYFEPMDGINQYTEASYRDLEYQAWEGYEALQLEP